jgi:hypothetical protein
MEDFLALDRQDPRENAFGQAGAKNDNIIFGAYFIHLERWGTRFSLRHR